MKLSLKPQHLKRYRQIASMLLRYGLSEVARSSGLEDLLGDEIGKLTQKAHPKPAELAAELEEMGPTFVKLGQVLSTRGDLVPAEYIAALQTLQDRVGPVPYPEVEQVVLEEFGLGIAHVFNTFEPSPLAAASLGQVHVASLGDGRKVAVKVQRPGIRARLAEDLDVLEELASVLEGVTEFAVRYRFKAIVADFRRTLMRELDYRTEADNLRTLGGNLSGFESIVVPRPVDELTTSRVLTMELVTGKKVTDITDDDRKTFDGVKLANELQKAYMKQVCIDGFFHADPHPGNVLLCPDGRIGLLDLGMVGRLSPEMRERLLRLLIALGEGRPEAAADLAVKIGHPGPRFDEAKFRGAVKTQVTANAGATMAQIHLGRVIMDIARASADCGLQPPGELTMLGKTLLSLDEVGRALAPGFDPYESVRREAIPLVLQMLKQGASATNILGRILEVNEFGRELPARVNKILDRVADNRLEVRVRSFDEAELIQGLQKVANRITQGLLIAALIVGAALLTNVNTGLNLMGYPALAVLLFVLAVGGAMALFWDIWRHDRKR